MYGFVGVQGCCGGHNSGSYHYHCVGGIVVFLCAVVVVSVDACIVVLKVH